MENFWYYADSANEACGPVSEEVLKNLFFQGRVTLDCSVLLAGTSDWSALRKWFPDLEFYRDCPRCHRKVTVEDRSCSHCKFPIANYERNLSDSRRRPVQEKKPNKATIDAAIRDDLAAYNTGSYLVFSIVIAILSCFIPGIGIFVGSIVFLAGVVGTLSPVGLKFWWYKNCDTEGLAKLRAKKLAQRTSPFIGPCPSCDRQIDDATSPVADILICPHCHAGLYHQGSYIYFIPFREALLR